MEFLYSKKFVKQYKKLDNKIKSKFAERLRLFQQDQFDIILNNHGLAGEFTGFRSINITGDYRLVYEVVDEDTVYLVAIGTHNQLYK